MIARFVRNINPYPLGAGVTAPSPGVRLVINRQKREGKAVSPEPDRATPPSKWLWTGCSTKVRRRRHGEPAHAGLRLPKRTRAGLKMGMDPGLACTPAQGCTQMGPGVKHRPKVTQNGYTERGNPSRALWRWNIARNAGVGDQAVCRDGVGCPKKPMPGVMPRIC
jgi:hypothetical protein